MTIAEVTTGTTDEFRMDYMHTEGTSLEVDSGTLHKPKVTYMTIGVPTSLDRLRPIRRPAREFRRVRATWDRLEKLIEGNPPPAEYFDGEMERPW
jgi:hypothetical protein